MGSSKQELRALLRSAGLRSTGPRLAVLGLLESSERPLGHSEVVELLGQDDWDQATLYRNLLKLVEAGLARVASNAGGVRRYELADDTPSATTHTHPHFVCKTCGRLECLPKAQVIIPMADGWAASLADVEVQVHGECPRCRA